MDELGSYLNQSVAYNITETVIVVFTIAFIAYIIKLALED